MVVMFHRHWYTTSSGHKTDRAAILYGHSYTSMVIIIVKILLCTISKIRIVEGRALLAQFWCMPIMKFKLHLQKFLSQVSCMMLYIAWVITGIKQKFTADLSSFKQRSIINAITLWKVHVHVYEECISKSMQLFMPAKTGETTWVCTLYY